MTAPSLLCSFREAARVLGVGRNSTLPGLIARGALRPVIVAGRQYIPREQLESLARHGESAMAGEAEKVTRPRSRKHSSLAEFKP